MKKYSKPAIFLESLKEKFWHWYILVIFIAISVIAISQRNNTLGFYIVVTALVLAVIFMLIGSLVSITQKNYRHSLLDIRRYLNRKKKLYHKYLVCLNKIHYKIEEEGDLSFGLALSSVMEVRRKNFVKEIEDIMVWWFSLGNESSEDEKLFKEYDFISKSNDLLIAAVLNKNLDKNSIFKQNYDSREKVENILHEIDEDIRLISCKVNERFVL